MQAKLNGPPKLLSLALGSILLTAGCCSKQCQLERVAKDWCMTIRASQVIPVYPLTEDVQPGDIYLVQVPIDQQQKVYESKGFLPLDNHVGRLNPIAYPEFYRNSFLAGMSNSLLPHDWIRPISTNVHPWEPAPHSAFPTYSFTVRRGEGINLAVPVDGVPVGLSLLNSDAADGTVSIKQARTIGLDMMSMWWQVQSWAKINAGFLSNFSPTAKETNFIRVITRVYATGQMDVSLRDASSRSAGADVGAAKPVNLLTPELPNGSNNAAVVAQNYTNGFNTLQEMLTKAMEGASSNNFLPGGSLRLTAASSRSVALQEQFDPPVVFGYLGFDCSIGQDGDIGPPIPTHAALDPKARLHHAKVAAFNVHEKQQIKRFHEISAAYGQANSAQQAIIRELARSAGLLPDTKEEDWTRRLGEQVDGNQSLRTAEFQQLKESIHKMNLPPQ